MECRDVILQRRSIRKYLDTPVSEDDIKDILEAALYAPSGTNLQPWYFVVLQKEEDKAKVRKLMYSVSKGMETSLKERFPRHPEVVDTTLSFVSSLGNAPVYILVFWYKPSYKRNDATINQSIGAAIQNLLLEAYNRGIGSCWLTAPIETGTDDLIQEEFAPDKGKLAALITLGYPAETPEAPRRKEGRYIIR